MKLIPFLIITFVMLGCGTDKNPIVIEPDNTDGSLTITASGIATPVTLLEVISNEQHEINADGIFDIVLPAGQQRYKLEIINSGELACTINNDLDLVCDAAICTQDVTPVCAKKPFSGIVCVTTPCDTDQYFTYDNSCKALADNAWIALESECGGLEEQVSPHIKPAYVSNIALIDIQDDGYSILESSIEDDILTILFEVSGGCGSHDFTFYADNVFLESFPVQLNAAVGYQANDSCDSIIQVEESFDLSPIQETYMRNYPDTVEPSWIMINEFGTYQF